MQFSASRGCRNALGFAWHEKSMHRCLIWLPNAQLGMAQTLIEGQWADQQQPWGWQGKNNRKLQSFLPGLDDQVSHWLGIACAWLCCTMYSPTVQQSEI